MIDKRGKECDRSNDNYKTTDVNSNDQSDDNNNHSNTENNSNVDNDRSNEDGRNTNIQHIDPDDILEFDETYGVVPRGLLERWRCIYILMIILKMIMMIKLHLLYCLNAYAIT